MRYSGLLVIACLLGTFTIAGCGGDSWAKKLPDTVTADGTITYNGVPLDNANIVFVPVDGEYAASGLSDSDGYFTMRAFPAKEGVVPGQYKVTVSKTASAEGKAQSFDPGEDSEHHDATAPVKSYISALPSKFSSPESSGLSADVPPEGTSELKLVLTPH